MKVHSASTELTAVMAALTVLLNTKVTQWYTQLSTKIRAVH